jgi:hypothetical protein
MAYIRLVSQISMADIISIVHLPVFYLKRDVSSLESVSVLRWDLLWLA